MVSGCAADVNRDIYAGGAGTGARQCGNQRQPWPAGWEGDATRERGRSTRQREQRACTDPLGLFPFLKRGAETRCSCCRGAGLSLCAAEAGPCSRGDPARPPGGPQTGSTFADPEGREPRRGTGFPGGHGRGLVLFVLGEKGPRSAAEWSAPWKRSFCASTQDRNKTVSCRSLFRLARAPASGQVRNLRRSRPGRWRPPTHGGRHGGAVKAPGNKGNGFARTPSVFFLFLERAAETRCSCCHGLLSVCWRSEGSVGNPAGPRVVALRAGLAHRPAPAERRGRRHPACGGGQSTITPFEPSRLRRQACGGVPCLAGGLRTPRVCSMLTRRWLQQTGSLMAAE